MINIESLHRRSPTDMFAEMLRVPEEEIAAALALCPECVRVVRTRFVGAGLGYDHVVLVFVKYGDRAATAYLRAHSLSTKWFQVRSHTANVVSLERVVRDRGRTLKLARRIHREELLREAREASICSQIDECR